MTDVLALALPGARQALRGRWGGGGAALVTWVLGWTTVMVGWDRVTSLDGYGLAEWAALVTLIVALAGPLAWSLLDHHRPPGETASSAWAEAGRAFTRNRMAVVAGLAILAVVLLALLAPYLAPYDPVLQGDLLTERYSGLSRSHLLGTDQLGRDVLSRLLYGGRISLAIGFTVVALSMALGTLVGAISGYLGGWVDGTVMRLVDVMLSFPRLVLMITLVAFFTPSIPLIVAVLAITQWPVMTRIVRGEVLALRDREFVIAARALGFSAPRVLFGHVLPNAMAPIIVAGTLAIGNTIVLEAGLSFLGVGLRPPAPSWGGMIADGRAVLLDAWWLATFPGLAIVLTVLAFNLVGDGLRDALDPRMGGTP